MSLILNAANVLVSIAGGIAAETATAGAGAAITGAISLNEVLRRLAGKAPAINARIAADLEAEMASQHLTDAQRTLIPQMIERAPLTPVEVMEAARNPARIAEAMLGKHTDPAHQIPANADAFRRTVIPVLTRLLADHATSDALRPAFENAVAESLRFIGEQVERMASQLHDTAYRLGVQDTLVLELARRYAPGSEGDFTAAIRGLEQALQTAAQMHHTARLPQNTSDQVDAVLAEVDRLNREGQLEAGAQALETALAEARDRIAQHTSGLMRMLDSAVDQARLLNRPDDAASALVERLLLDQPADPFAALRLLREAWYERGRDQGLAFEATVALHLAEHTLPHAKTPDRRGEALNDLGIALQILGERGAGTSRLEQAVLAFQQALVELTRKRVPQVWARVQANLGATLETLGTRQAGRANLQQAVQAFEQALQESDREIAPLDWATMQNNLGNALSILGEREAGTARLEQAVLAYLDALTERTRDRVPLDWAMTKNNLGNTLLSLGEREAGTDRLEHSILAYQDALMEYSRNRVPLNWATIQNNLGTALHTLGERKSCIALLEQAVLAYQEALKEMTRDRVPLCWATTQNNLGNALKSLGTREMSTVRLEQAVLAYQQALTESTNERVPLDWASTQFNLAAVEIVFFDKTGDPAHLARGRDYSMAAREVFVAAGADHYIGMADRQLAKITKREQG